MLLLNIATAYVFFKLGKTGELPKIRLKPRGERQKQEGSMFTDPDLEDIRDVEPKKVLDQFMSSLTKKQASVSQPNVSQGQVAEDFQEMIN